MRMLMRLMIAESRTATILAVDVVVQLMGQWRRILGFR